MAFNLKAISDLPGKLAIVTGANSGIGLEIALALAKKRVRVVMACRDQLLAERARQKILLDVPNGNLEILPIDLSSLRTVRTAADEYCRNHDRVDLLINNAGVMYPPYKKTEDGFELQLGTNCLGHFLLTSLLLELMPDRAESRIVWLSSSAHKTGKIYFDDINFEKKYSKAAAYAQSKLVCLMYALELDRRLKSAGKKIIANSAHPGGVITNLSRNMSRVVLSLMKLTFLRFITHSSAEGAMPVLEAALSPVSEGGQYYGPQGFLEMKGPSGVATIAKRAKNSENAKRIWELSEEYTGAYFNL